MKTAPLAIMYVGGALLLLTLLLVQGRLVSRAWAGPGKGVLAERRAQEINSGPRPSFKVGAAMRRFVPKEPYNWRGAQTHALITQIWYLADQASIEQPQWIGPTNAPLFSAGKS